MQLPIGAQDMAYHLATIMHTNL